MRKLLVSLFATALATTPALADWTGKNAAGGQITFFNTGDCTSVVCKPQAQLIDASGVAFGTTGNPIFINFASGATLPAYGSTPTFNLGTIGTAATAANQATGNASLSSIDGKLPVLGQALAAASIPVVLPASQVIAGGPNTVASSVPFIMTSQYPVNTVTTTPTPLTGNAAGTTGAVVGTLSGAASATTYVCHVDVQAIGGTAAVGPMTLAGLVGSSMVFQGSSTVAGGTVVTRDFNPCVAASAVNTAITMTTTANGTATAVNVNMSGYRL